MQDEGLAQLLGPEALPLHVSVRDTERGVFVRLDTSEPVSFDAIPSLLGVMIVMGFVGALGWGCVPSVLALPCSLLFGAALGFAALAGLRVTQRALRRVTVEGFELLPHGIHWRCTNAVEGPVWSVHEVAEPWASADVFSGIVAARMRSGELQALRVQGRVQTRWVYAVVQRWCESRGTEPDEPVLARIGALGGAARSETIAKS